MALITCPECGKEYSSMAAACPHCGYTKAEDTRTLEGCGKTTSSLGQVLTCCITVPIIIVFVLFVLNLCSPQ